MRLARLAISGLLAISSFAANASLIYDNGAPVENACCIKFNSDQWTIYDDFVLNERSAITGLSWSQFDEDVTYAGTTISLFDVIGGAPLISFDVVASRILNGLSRSSVAEAPFDGPVTGYNYFAFLGVLLEPGTYYVGIHNDVSGGFTLMARSGSSGPAYQSNADGIWQFNSRDFAFQVYGDSVSVPEPTTLSLLVTGLLGMTLIRRRRNVLGPIA